MRTAPPHTPMKGLILKCNAGRFILQNHRNICTKYFGHATLAVLLALFLGEIALIKSFDPDLHSFQLRPDQKTDCFRLK